MNWLKRWSITAVMAAFVIGGAAGLVGCETEEPEVPPTAAPVVPAE